MHNYTYMHSSSYFQGVNLDLSTIQFFPAKFMPFKTPLSGEYDRQLKEEDRFHVSMLISYVEAAQQRMGMVVDLTKTDRYYDKRELLHHGIGHHKIVCEGYV